MADRTKSAMVMLADRDARVARALPCRPPMAKIQLP